MSLPAYTVLYTLPDQRTIAVTVYAHNAIHAEEMVIRDSNGNADVLWVIEGDDHHKAFSQYLGEEA